MLLYHYDNDIFARAVLLKNKINYSVAKISTARNIKNPQRETWQKYVKPLRKHDG